MPVPQRLVAHGGVGNYCSFRLPVSMVFSVVIVHNTAEPFFIFNSFESLLPGTAVQTIQHE